MHSIYIHLSGRDVDGTLLAMYGLATDGEEKPTLKAITCPRCKESCPPTADHCSKCGSPTDPTQLCGLESERTWVDPVMTELLEDSQTQQFLVRRIRELNLYRFISRDALQQELAR
jgi:hypothetical protein